MRACLAAALLVLGLASNVGAQEQYRGIAAPPYEFYEALVNQAGSADHAALGRSVHYLLPLFAAIRARTGEDCEVLFRSAVGARDRRAMQGAVRRLLFLDLRMNIEESARASSREGRSEFLQMAYTDYYYLAPLIADRDSNRRVKAEFRRANGTADPRAFREATSATLKLLEPHCSGGGTRVSH